MTPRDDDEDTPLERPARARTISSAITSWGIVEAWLALDGHRRVGFYASNARGMCAWAGVAGEDPYTLPQERLEPVQPNDDPSLALVRATRKAT